VYSIGSAISASQVNASSAGYSSRLNLVTSGKVAP